MSVLIKDMEKPKSCYAIIDGEAELCPFVNTDDDCVLLLKKGICEGKWEDQYSKCPLVETSEPCEDAVSRAEVIDLIEASDLDLADRMDNQVVCSFVKMIPAVTPKRKTGRWVIPVPRGSVIIYSRAYWECDQCQKATYLGNKMKFCPNCGAKMDGGE